MDIRRLIDNCDGVYKPSKYLCYGNDTISKSLDFTKNWESYLIQKALSYLKDDSVILDIGANIGVWSINLATKQRKIYSFEPFKSSYMALCGNIFLNKLEANITPYNIALTDDININYEFKLDEECNIGGVRLIKKEKDTINPFNDIKLSTIDMLNLEKLDLIKLDVEGHELKVLKGGIETIKKCKPIIFFECWTKESYKKEKEALFNFITNELNYEIKSLKNNWMYMDDFIGIPMV